MIRLASSSTLQWISWSKLIWSDNVYFICCNTTAFQLIKILASKLIEFHKCQDNMSESFLVHAFLYHMACLWILTMMRKSEMILATIATYLKPLSYLHRVIQISNIFSFHSKTKISSSNQFCKNSLRWFTIAFCRMSVTALLVDNAHACSPACRRWGSIWHFVLYSISVDGRSVACYGCFIYAVQSIKNSPLRFCLWIDSSGCLFCWLTSIFTPDVFFTPGSPGSNKDPTRAGTRTGWCSPNPRSTCLQPFVQVGSQIKFCNNSNKL